MNISFFAVCSLLFTDKDLLWLRNKETEKQANTKKQSKATAFLENPPPQLNFFSFFLVKIPLCCLQSDSQTQGSVQSIITNALIKRSSITIVKLNIVKKMFTFKLIPCPNLNLWFLVTSHCKDSVTLVCRIAADYYQKL